MGHSHVSTFMQKMKVTEYGVILFCKINISMERCQRALPVLPELQAHAFPTAPARLEDHYLYLVPLCPSRFLILEAHQDDLLFTSVFPAPCTMPGSRSGGEWGHKQVHE